MTKRIDAREIAGLTTDSLTDFDHSTPPAPGQVPVWNPTGGDGTGAYEPGTVAGGDSSALVPLTTTVGGVPQLVWDDNDNLVMVEVPL